MKTNSVIYWFSATGNSLAIATDLAQTLGDTDLIPIPGIINRVIPSYEKIGIVFPVYAFGLPLIIRRFLQKLPAAKANYIYTLATMGGMAGAVHSEARELLREQGARLASGWSVAMPGNYAVLYPPPPDEKQARIFEKARQRTNEIATAVSAGKTGIYEDTAIPLRWLFSPMRKMAVNRFPEADEKFTAGPNCQHCGLCAKVCPVENIRIVEGKPVWMHHCEQCLACLQWCPVQAIEYGGKSTVGRKRYHHPRFKAKDFFMREE